jgi:uncharacterized low-complexity protein
MCNQVGRRHARCIYHYKNYYTHQEHIMNPKMKKPLAVAIGAAFLATAAIPVLAGNNPFTANPLTSGYDQVNKSGAEGKCGEGKCGEAKKAAKEGKCGEGKCGEAKKGEKAEGEGKCGEGKCGEAKKGEKAEGEGKCGEGKCGGM